VNDAVAGVEQVEFFPVERDRLVGVDEQPHVAAAGGAFLNQGDEIGEQLFTIAAVFAQEGFVGLLVHLGVRDESFQILFDNQRTGDRVGFDFLIAKRIPEEREEKFIL